MAITNIIGNTVRGHVGNNVISTFTNRYKHLKDTLTLTDSLSRQAEFKRTTAETVTFTDQITTQLNP